MNARRVRGTPATAARGKTQTFTLLLAVTAAAVVLAVCGHATNAEPAAPIQVAEAVAAATGTSGVQTDAGAVAEQTSASTSVAVVSATTARSSSADEVAVVTAVPMSEPGTERTPLSTDAAADDGMSASYHKLNDGNDVPLDDEQRQQQHLLAPLLMPPSSVPSTWSSPQQQDQQQKQQQPPTASGFSMEPSQAFMIGRERTIVEIVPVPSSSEHHIIDSPLDQPLDEYNSLSAVGNRSPEFELPVPEMQSRPEQEQPQRPFEVVVQQEQQQHQESRDQQQIQQQQQQQQQEQQIQQQLGHQEQQQQRDQQTQQQQQEQQIQKQQEQQIQHQQQQPLQDQQIQQQQQQESQQQQQQQQQQEPLDQQQQYSSPVQQHRQYAQPQPVNDLQQVQYSYLYGNHEDETEEQRRQYTQQQYYQQQQYLTQLQQQHIKQQQLANNNVVVAVPAFAPLPLPSSPAHDAGLQHPFPHPYGQRFAGGKHLHPMHPQPPAAKYGYPPSYYHRSFVGRPSARRSVRSQQLVQPQIAYDNAFAAQSHHNQLQQQNMQFPHQKYAAEYGKDAVVGMKYDLQHPPQDAPSGKHAHQPPFRPSHPVWASEYPVPWTYYVKTAIAQPAGQQYAQQMAAQHGGRKSRYAQTGVGVGGAAANRIGGHATSRHAQPTAKVVYIEYGGFKPKMVPSAQISEELDAGHNRRQSADVGDVADGSTAATIATAATVATDAVAASTTTTTSTVQQQQQTEPDQQLATSAGGVVVVVV